MLVRIFGHRGMEQLPINIPKQYTADSVFQLVQPYEFAQTLTSNAATAVASAPTAAPDATQILRVEVPDGQVIRYEVNPPGRAIAASVNSPRLSGINMLYFRQGWTLSIIDASAVAP